MISLLPKALTVSVISSLSMAVKMILCGYLLNFRKNRFPRPDVTVRWETCHSTSNCALPAKLWRRSNTSNRFTISHFTGSAKVKKKTNKKNNLHTVKNTSSELCSSCSSVLLLWSATLEPYTLYNRGKICLSWGWWQTPGSTYTWVLAFYYFTTTPLQQHHLKSLPWLHLDQR